MRATAVDIQRWIPRSFEQVVGNEEIIETFENGLRVGGQIPNTLVIGESRSGKTSGISLFVKSLLCERRDKTATSACDECFTCSGQASRYGHSGIFAQLRVENTQLNRAVHFIPIDCTRISEAELRDTLDQLQDYDGLRILYLDELFRLQRRGMDELLLKPMEQLNFVWLASSATVKGLERMFLNRFPIKIKTTLPSRDALSEWIAHRCLDWEIVWDKSETLVRLAERSNLVPGMALQVVARAAASPSRELTARLVDRHHFDEDET